MKFLFYFPTYIFSKSFWTNKIKMKFLIVATVISCLLLSVYGAEYAKCYFPEDGSVKGHVYFMEDDDATYGHILLTVQGKHRRFPVHIHDGVCTEAFTPFDDPNTPGLQSYLGDFLATPKGLVLISNFETSDISLNKNNSIVGRSVVVQMSGKEDQACCEVVPSNEEEYYSHSDEHDHHGDDHDDHHEDEDHLDDGDQHEDHNDHDDHKEDNHKDEELDVDHDDEDHDDHDDDDDYNHISDGEEDHGERTEVEEEKEDFNQMNAELLYIMLLKKFLGQL